MQFEMHGLTTVAGLAINRSPALWLQHQTTAPTGHSMMAATQKPMNPNVGPMILHRHGLSVLPHSIQSGMGMQAILGYEVEDPWHRRTLRIKHVPQSSLTT